MKVQATLRAAEGAGADGPIFPPDVSRGKVHAEQGGVGGAVQAVADLDRAADGGGQFPGKVDRLRLKRPVLKLHASQATAGHTGGAVDILLEGDRGRNIAARTGVRRL